MEPQWLLNLCNGIVKEGCIPEDWKSSVVVLIYKGKGDPMQCESYRGTKLLEHAMKVVEKIFEHTMSAAIKRHRNPSVWLDDSLIDCTVLMY